MGQQAYKWPGRDANAALPRGKLHDLRFRALLGDVAWASLPEAIRRRFGRHPGPGATVTYAGIAGRIGAPRARRAVATACAANAVAVAIPCHRVIRQDGTLSGYRWGADRKRALLAREARA